MPCSANNNIAVLLREFVKLGTILNTPNKRLDQAICTILTTKIRLLIFSLKADC